MEEVDWNDDCKWILLFDNLILSHDKPQNHGIINLQNLKVVYALSLSFNANLALKTRF